MDFRIVTIAALGYALGIVVAPALQRVQCIFDRRFVYGHHGVKSQLLPVLSLFVRPLAMVVMLLGPLYAFGAIPLCNNGQYYFLSILLGAASFQIWDWWFYLRRRPDSFQVAQAELDRKRRVEESIAVEIAEQNDERHKNHGGHPSA